MSLTRTIARRIERRDSYLEILDAKGLLPKGSKWPGLFAGRTFSGARRRMKQSGGKKPAAVKQPYLRSAAYLEGAEAFLGGVAP